MRPVPQVEIFNEQPWPSAVAALIAREVASAVAARGVCHLALSGGETPEPAYRALAALDVPWSAVELWWSDERCVPGDHPAMP